LRLTRPGFKPSTTDLHNLLQSEFFGRQLCNLFFSRNERTQQPEEQWRDGHNRDKNMMDINDLQN
jgi:hypothetical protein